METSRALENRFAGGYQDRLDKLEEENKLMRSLFGNILPQEYSRLMKENLELKIYKAKVEEHNKEISLLNKLHKEEIARINIEHERDIAKLKESHEHGLKSVEGRRRSVSLEKMELQRLNDNIATHNKSLASTVEEQNIEIDKKTKEIEMLEKSLEDHKRHSEMLEKALEKITGIKGDTEKIISLIASLDVNVNIDGLVEKLQEVRGLSEEDVCKLTKILIAHEKLILTSTKGKSIAKDIEQIKGWINIAKDVINNGGSCNLEIAKKNGMTSTPALASKVKTIKNNGIYDLVSDYLQNGLSDELLSKYGTTHKEEIDILKEEE